MLGEITIVISNNCFVSRLINVFNIIIIQIKGN